MKTRMLLATAAALLAAAAIGSVGAQAPARPAATPAAAPAQTITFDDAIRMALQQNNAIKVAQNATASDAASVQQAKLQFLPDLRVSGTTTTSVTPNSGLGTIGTGGTNGALGGSASQSLNAGLSSSFTLFDGFRNASALHAAQASQQASAQDLARAKQTVVFTVASNYLTLITAQEQLAVQQQSLAAEQALEKEIQAYVDAGERPISDLYQQQASVANAQAAVVDAERASELGKVDLIQTLQLDPAGTYDFQAPTVDEAAAANRQYDLQSLIAQAMTQRADLAAQSSRVAAAEQGVKEARSSKYPTVSITAGYNTTYNSTLSSAMMSQLGQRQGGSIGIGVSVPLFDKGATSTATEKAELQADDAQLALANAKQSAALDVRRAYLDYQSAQQRLIASEAQKKAADMALTTTTQRYEAGKATLVEVTQARTTQVQANTGLVSARYNLVFQQSLMSYYTGALDPAAVKLG